jgi:membrane protein implicated in regulation of membrane protease activity
MSGMRDHLVLFIVAMIVGCAVLIVAGLGTWNPWFQLAAPLLLMMVCSRLLAPVYYGWREPGDRADR